MCGIFAYSGNKKTAGDLILNGLKSLEYRGYDSWGVAVKQTSGELYIQKHVGKIGDAKLPRLEALVGIGHTRWATHGGVTEANSHPHTDCTKEVVIVHNGIVENFQELKDNLLKKRHKFSSETDSEVIAHLLEEEIAAKQSFNDAVLAVFKKISGLNAIIALYLPTEEFAAIKSGSPLVYGYQKNSEEHFLASDSSSILPHTRTLYFLEDFELLSVSKKRAALHDINGKKKELKLITVKETGESFTLGDYPHFMIKEISEQPKVLHHIAKDEQKNIEFLAEKIKNAYGTYFIGCGTAYYAALAGTYLFSKTAKRHVNVSVGSEFTWLVDFLKEKSLVLAFSQSGETVDIISSMKAVKEKGAKIASVTNVFGSTLYRMSDYKLLLGAGPEKCVLATKSFTAKIAVLTLLAEALNGGYKKGEQKILMAANAVKKLVANNSTIKDLAKRLKSKEHIYIFGRGLSYPVALESALKIKEGSYIHAEGFAAGELKHGVIALIEKGTPVIVYNPTDETYEDTLSSTYEVKARGAYIIGVSSKNNSVYDEYIEVADSKEATIIPNVVVAQLLGYYLTLERGYDPDKPRNLAKSVTVK